MMSLRADEAIAAKSPRKKMIFAASLPYKKKRGTLSEEYAEEPGQGGRKSSGTNRTLDAGIGSRTFTIRESGRKRSRKKK